MTLDLFKVDIVASLVDKKGRAVKRGPDSHLTRAGKQALASIHISCVSDVHFVLNAKVIGAVAMDNTASRPLVPNSKWSADCDRTQRLTLSELKALQGL